MSWTVPIEPTPLPPTSWTVYALRGIGTAEQPREVVPMPARVIEGEGGGGVEPEPRPTVGQLWPRRG